MLELVLNIEQPDPGRSREQHDWQVHEQERPDADQPNHRGDHSRDGGIGRAGAKPGLPATAHQADWQPMLDEEQVGRAQAEHDDGVPIDAIAQPPPRRQREVLTHGERVDIPDPAAVEIARCRVVDGVSASPEVVRRERQHPDHASDPVIGETAMEEGAVTAIVLDHE